MYGTDQQNRNTTKISLLILQKCLQPDLVLALIKPQVFCEMVNFRQNERKFLNQMWMDHFFFKICNLKNKEARLSFCFLSYKKTWNLLQKQPNWSIHICFLVSESDQ